MGNNNSISKVPQNQIGTFAQEQPRNTNENILFQFSQSTHIQNQECLQTTIKLPHLFHQEGKCASKNLFTQTNGKIIKEKPQQKILFSKYHKRNKDLQQYSAGKQKLIPLTFSTFCSIQQLQTFGMDKIKQSWHSSYTQFNGDLQGMQSFPEQLYQKINVPLQFLTKFISRYANSKIEQQQFIRIKKQDINKDYQFIQKIGEGTFGEVFKCINRRTNQLRAIKRLRTNIFSNPRIKQQFMQQFTILRKTSHPNIIKMHELYQHNHFMHIVFQFCSAGTLANLLKRIPLLPIDLVRQILKQILRALNYLHSSNIVHRDIKPQNIVLTKDIHRYSNPNDIDIRIIDFGLSVMQQKGKIFKDWAKIGTVSYMAPQVFTGIYSSKCDSWSCGVIMYELIAGNNPFKLTQTLQAQNNIHCFVPHSNHKAEERWLALGADCKTLQLKLLSFNYVSRYKINESIKHSSFFQRKCDQVIQQARSNLKQYKAKSNLVSNLQSYLSYTYISQQQQKRYSYIFNYIDSDSNGLIMLQQLTQFLTSIYPTLSNQEIQYIFNKINKSQNGRINFGEFVNAFMDKRHLFNSLYLIQALNFMDLNQNHRIEKDQLKFFMKSLQKQEIDYTFQHQFKSQQSYVNFDAILAYIKQQISEDKK